MMSVAVARSGWVQAGLGGVLWGWRAGGWGEGRGGGGGGGFF